MKNGSKNNKKNVSYGARSFKSTLPWSNSELEVIATIQKEYQLYHQNLAEQLINAMNFIKTREELIRSNPSIEEQVVRFTELIDAIERLQAILDIGNMGIKIRREISRTMLNSTRKFSYLEKILNQLEQSSRQAIFNVKLTDTNDINNKLPKNDDNEKTKSIIKPILNHLFDTFTNGSEQQPTVYKSMHNPLHYDGKLFNFCVEVISLFEKKGNIRIAKPSTIGDYLIEIRKERCQQEIMQ